MGRAGSGKSHLAAAAFFTGWEAGLKGRFFTFNQLTDKLKSTYDNPDGPRYAGLLEEYKQLPMLVIDDLGTQRPTEADIKIIYELINYRAGNIRLWTIVTTNLSGPQLAEWFGERVKSRLGKLYFDRLVIVAPDWRAEDW
jgi:DNA replication protein DnaC